MQLSLRARFLIAAIAAAAVLAVLSYAGYVAGPIALPFVLGVVLAAIVLLVLSNVLLLRWVERPVRAMTAAARRVADGEEAQFASDRPDDIGRLAATLETMRVRAVAQRAAVAADARHASIMNQFVEVATFVEDDAALASAALDALAEMGGATAGAVHIVAPTHEKASLAARTDAVEVGDVAVAAMDACPGVRRGTLYTTPDLERSMSIRCPVYPASTGALACLPLTAGREVVGVAHLHWSEPRTLQIDVRTAMTRVTENAGTTIANRRLLGALRRQSPIDPHTNLMNAETFDRTLEKAMVGRRPRHQLAVLLVDIDDFASFNDRNGTPAGDDALRFFARTLNSCLRDADVAARYGPEEFAVLLPEVALGLAMEVAERIRAKTEMSVVPVGEDANERITVSIGVAVAPQDGGTRVDLLRAADTALHEAKLSGRNRVQAASDLVVEDDARPDSREVSAYMVVINREVAEAPGEALKA